MQLNLNRVLYRSKRLSLQLNRPLRYTRITSVLFSVVWWPGRGAGGHGAPVTIFLGALKSEGSAKIRNCQCEISYKICKVQLVNKFKVVVILAFL